MFIFGTMARVVDVYELSREDEALYTRACEEAAQMLVAQWPSVKLSTRLQSITQPVADRKKREQDEQKSVVSRVPCSMVMLDTRNGNKVIGHINIQAAVDHLEGKACIAYAGEVQGLLSKFSNFFQ
jgi:hypothetical protein